MLVAIDGGYGIVGAAVKGEGGGGMVFAGIWGGHEGATGRGVMTW